MGEIIELVYDAERDEDPRIEIVQRIADTAVKWSNAETPHEAAIWLGTLAQLATMLKSHGWECDTYSRDD